MSDTKRLIRPLITIVLLGATGLGLYNVFSDNTEVRKLAESTACGAPDCSVALTREAKNPIAQTFTFQTDMRQAGQKQPTVEVSCHRALYLVGEYSCEAK